MTVGFADATYQSKAVSDPHVFSVPSPKAPPPEGAKSNPSKRHRDRLNGELDKLTSLLPFSEEVRSRLDKLSVLRLSVGYLKVKSFFNASLKKGAAAVNVVPALSSAQHQVSSIDGVNFSEGDLLLQALNGFVLVVTAEGYIFYTSPTIQDFLGFHQSDVVHQSVFELIHTEDRALFRQQLHFALDPNTTTSQSNIHNSADVSTNLVTYDPKIIPQENTSFLERNFCCRFRCLLDNSSGFLALNFFGRLKYLHGQNQRAEDGTLVPPQLALFSVVTPLQPPSILEIRTKTLLFQTKHKLDFTPLGIDARGEVILGYTEMELCAPGSGYHFVHAADMMYCADQHLKMMKTGVSGFTVFRLLTKNNSWMWVQSNARLVFKGGKPDFVIAKMKALMNEEGEEHLRLRRLQLPFSCASGDALLYDLAPSMEPPEQCSVPKQRKTEYTVTPNSILGSMLGQDQSLYCPHSPPSISSMHDVAFRDTHATVSVPGDLWPLGSSAAPGTVMKTESSVQDMMDTLQQVLGDSDLVSSLGVEPEELRSWESTLMSLNVSSSDLNTVLSRDILSIVEEQFQKEGGFTFLDHLEDVPRSLSSLDLHTQSPDQELLQDLQLPLDCLSDIIPKTELMPQAEAPQVTSRLSHMDGPALKGTVPLCYSFGAENQNNHRAVDPGFPLQCAQPQGFLKACVNSNGRTSQSSAEQLQPRQAALPPPLHHPELGGTYTQTPLNQGISSSCPQWNYAVPKQTVSMEPGPFSSISDQRSNPCMLASSVQCPPEHRPVWPQTQSHHTSLSNGYHHMNHSLQHESQPSSCMFSQPCVNGVPLSSELHPEPSRLYCLYQEHQEVPNPPMSFNLDTQLQPVQPFFSQQTKVTPRSFYI
uniref:Aryl hydrocarbon receptor n=1 Tax=Periophthalmus magnuspinnatus TaxID=409849 RepID=A0A3B4A3M9_9GOBI